MVLTRGSACRPSDPGLDRAFRKLGTAPCQGPDAKPPAFVQCRMLYPGQLLKCRGLPPAVLWLVGAEGSAPGGLRGLLNPAQITGPSQAYCQGCMLSFMAEAGKMRWRATAGIEHAQLQSIRLCVTGSPDAAKPWGPCFASWKHGLHDLQMTVQQWMHRSTGIWSWSTLPQGHQHQPAGCGGLLNRTKRWHNSWEAGQSHCELQNEYDVTCRRGGGGVSTPSNGTCMTTAYEAGMARKY